MSIESGTGVGGDLQHSRVVAQETEEGQGMRMSTPSQTGLINFKGPIRANRFADSPESPEGSRTEPLFCESRFGALTLANRRFEAIRANRSNVMKI